MSNRRVIIQALLCFALILGMIVPAPLVGASSLAMPATDSGLVAHYVIDMPNGLSEVTLNADQRQATPMVAAGGSHTVGVRSDGSVVAVGDNGSGQCDVGDWKDMVQVSAGYWHTVGVRSDGTAVATGWTEWGMCNVGDWTDVVQVAAGSWHTVGLRSDGSVMVVGRNSWGEFDFGDWTDIVQVSAGYWHTVGVKSDGTVVAVGWNDEGQCNVDDWTEIVQVSGYSHTVGLKSDGTVVAVGRNDEGQCNVGDWTEIVQVSANYGHTVGLKSDGTAVATGWNEYGACDVDGWTDIVQVAAGPHRTVGLKSDGTIVAVGDYYYGECKVGDWMEIVRVSAGHHHTLGLKSDGTVVAAGHSRYGQCDVGDWRDMVQVSAGYWHTVGVKSDGTVVAVGWNDEGQCNVDDWTEIVQVSTGYSHTVGLRSDDTVVAVGDNYYGWCDVGGWTDIVHVAAGLSHTVGLKSDGTVVAVGRNYYGQCNVDDWTEIVQVSTGYSHTVGLRSDGTVVAVGSNAYGLRNVDDWTDIVQVAAGQYHTVGLKSDGTVVAIGRNRYGQCNVDGWTGIAQVAAGGSHTVGLKSDGSAVAAGAESELARWNLGETAPPPVTGFLTLPFTDPGIRIQQGWRYTAPIGPNPDDPYAHNGIDYIKGVFNSPTTWQSFDVVAAAGGVAMWSSGGGYGDFVLIRHDETDPQDRNYFTLYGHLGDIEDNIAHRVDRFATDYQNWTPVIRGQKIGEAGETGSPGLIHLHFEVQRGGYAQNKVDPYDICSTRDYYPGGSSYVGCGPNSLWAVSVCPAEPDRDDARYVADVTIPDGTTVQPGEGFVKTWRVRNTGTTTWSTDYRLVFDGGDPMDAPQYVNLEAPVPPNAIVDMSVSMTAPLSGGAKRGYWRMENPAGLRFGQTVWVEMYVPHAPAPELQEAIDKLYNTTIQNLEYLKEAMETTAEHGDFFRRQVTTEQAALAVTLVSGFVSMGADVLDSIEHAKYVFRLTHPGMDITSGGWWHELQSYEVGKHLFSAHQWQHLWATSPQAFSREILNNNWMTYASMIGGTVRDELAPNEALNLMREMAGNEDCFSGQVYPHLVSAIDMAKQHLTETRSETLSSLPSLSPEEQAAYAGDLNSRATAAQYLYQSSTYTVPSLGDIRGFYETDPLTRGALAVLKFAARALATASFDGPGKLLVDGFLTAFDAYIHSVRLNESQRMVALAEGLLESGMRTSTQLHLNAFSGIRQVEDLIAPQTVTGSIGSISHWSQGYNPRWRPRTPWVETASYSIVGVTNNSTGTDSATFRIVAAYPAEYEALRFIQSAISDTAESEITQVSPGETVYVRLNYRDESRHSSPARGGQMYIWLLGSSDSGTFAVDQVGTRWEPHLAPRVTGQVMPSLAVAENGEEIEIFDNPVSVFLSASHEDLTYEVQTWVINPVSGNVTAIIQHDLCNDWQVLSAPGAQSSNSTHLVWELELEEGDLAGVTFTFAYNGDLSLDIVVPGPVAILETADGEFLGELVGNSPSLKPILPLTGSVTMPVQVLPGDQAPVSVALQNLSTETIDGDVIISVIDPTGSSAYNETQSFSLASSANATLDYLLPAFPEKGLYQVLTEISHGGVTRVLGRDVLRVGTFALAVGLNATPADRVYPGDTITYTVSLNNTSGVTLNNITVQAAVPTETLAHDISDDGQLDGSVVEWQLPDPVFPGGTVELWFQATVKPDVIGPDQARNINSSVTAASDESLPVGSNEVRILLVPSPAAVMGTIMGEADLYGQMDNSGVLVAVNGTYITTTASDGSFAIDVPEGSHNVTFAYPGFNTVVGENVSVIAGEEVALPLVVLVPSTIVTGQTREVNCDMLPEATVCLYQDQVLVDCAVSDGDGVFTLAVMGFGDYQLVVSKDGFRDEMRAISVTEPITHTIGFDGDHGLIPNAPNMSYVLACINLWQFGEPQCKPSMSRVLAVINAWQFPE